MKIYRWVGGAALGLLLLAPARSRADGPDTYSVGSRGAALAGAMGAGSDDWTSAYYNPSGLAARHNISAGIGIVAGVDHLQGFKDVVLGYDKNGVAIRGPVGADYENVYGVIGGLALPVSKRLSFGMMIWAPGQRLVRIMTVDAFIPHYALYVNRAQRITSNFGLAYRVSDRLRVGIGGSSLAKSNFASDINIPAGDGSNPDDSRGLITLDIIPTLVPTGGFELDVSKALTVSASYRGETDLRVHVNQTSGADTVFPVGPSLRFKSKVDISGGFLILDHYTPQQVIAGLKWDRPGSPLALFFDTTWENWSAYRGPYIDPNFDDIVVPPLGNIAVNWRHPPPVRFRDTFVPRLGAEWKLSDSFALRGGYFYEMTPAPLANGEANVLDANAHVVSAGAGIKFRDPLHHAKNPIALNLHARVRELETTTSKKAVTYDCNDPSQKPPVGYPCSGSITASGQIFSGGADFSFEF